MTGKTARIAVQQLAADQDGVVSRAQARALGVDRGIVRREVEAGHWRTIGKQSIATHVLPVGGCALWRAALNEAGEHAALDGVTSLQASGLTGFDGQPHLIVPWPSEMQSLAGVDVHSSRLWNPDDFIERNGMRLTRPDVAAVRAAMRVRTDRAAATVMAMTVQQGLTTGELLLLQAKRLNRHKRRPTILVVAGDIADGARALGELDFTDWCRRRGLPPPNRQVLRRGKHGRVYLDVYWDDFHVVVEIEGAHHDAPENAIGDSLRQNAITIGKVDSFLRIPVLGLRTCSDPFMDQVEQALRAAGWFPAAA